MDRHKHTPSNAPRNAGLDRFHTWGTPAANRTPLSGDQPQTPSRRYRPDPRDLGDSMASKPKRAKHPTDAGTDQSSPKGREDDSQAPRTGGDQPKRSTLRPGRNTSPRVRGSTGRREQGNRRNPAHAAGIDRAAPAGIDRSRDRMIRDIDRPARARIDPFAGRPRPRPARAGIDRTVGRVLSSGMNDPARAGINPSSPNPVARRSKRPRTRGDHPSRRRPSLCHPRPHRIHRRIPARSGTRPKPA